MVAAQEKKVLLLRSMHGREVSPFARISCVAMIGILEEKTPVVETRPYSIRHYRQSFIAGEGLTP